ncbi:RecQ family ATP-dependent DNA helicase (plasmid) [Cereibacter azotoformans]|uniref:RecQ family ATP-dependent DNA helicase n=1 Tax=Cereibacter azotoformans TaxID=43057 RepID=UPI000E35DBE5|nr:RecQ family ATP-dependent DNA helicase [Cereibacter azotoformans]AXQ96069.1 RecQ family ATP-dependent DNA helicase [Cereibacter sphaeroides]UIJ32907.1 RecQ family ATP-dependent DNA helicase [Cereibacter azotoformans]
MNRQRETGASVGALLGNCVSLDLEVDPRTARLFAFAAVRTGDGEVCRHSGGDPGPALDRLGAFCEGADHLIGHNILRHDLPHLVAQRPRFTAMGQSVIDTLWLNPLAFPRNPYHHLVKHYHDGRLQAGHVNDPELDARLVFEVLENQIAAFGHMQREDPGALLVPHFLTTRGETSAGFDALFRAIRGRPPPSAPEAEATIRRLLAGRACAHRIEQTLSRISNPQLGWPMAYALSWISVAGGDSVMPPWVRTQFREAALIVRHLRDTACGSPDCAWCAANNDPKRALERWFGFPAFRPEPVDEMGRPLQERIVAEAMAGKSVLGILPTGTGKSVCYQIPALSKFDKTGALTVVISPLVALMADQVQGLARAGISSAVTVNGMLSLPERHHALEQVRMGDAAILLIAPEQLRSVSVRSALRQREVGLWVLDEAHCISKWGHDFRPDYRYVSRFIREFSGDEPPAPVLCLTATAKPEVVRDIREHFQSRVGQELQLLDGGAVRTNLSFSILPTQRQTKLADILDAIEADLPAEGASGAVVYCATRSATERVAEFLKAQGLAAERFHAGLPPEEKREIQERFRVGELRVIAATNAFGMGIDKPDIRLVVHGDIPGSLENYLQEAGRAGRDRQPARCVLLFAAEDVERQFGLSARSRLARHEIGAILKALRRLETRTKKNGEVVATPGEIVREEKDQEFERDRATDDTRVKTAVAWLEEATLLSREENRVQVFPSSLRIRTLEEAAGILDKAQVTGTRRTQLLDLVRHVMTAPADTGISTDDLTGACGLTGPALRKALSDLEVLGIASNDTAITIFIHVGVEDASLKRLELAARLETDLIALMREAAPEADGREPEPLHLTETTQALRDRGHAGVRPDLVEALLKGLAQDGRDQEGGRGNLHLRKASRNTLFVRLQRSWPVLEQTASLRRQGAGILLRHLIGRVPKGVRGKDVQVETTLGHMQAALNGDALLRASVQDMNRLMDRALLWLHEQQVATLGRGLTVFRPAMTVHLNPKGTTFTVQNFAPLEEHYTEQTMQTHAMAAYAERGLTAMSEAERLAEDYFVLEREAFLRRWLPGKGVEIRRQTTGASWKAIVEALENPVQAEIVRDDREQTNVLVLAGPGSGKTRVLVHRIAYLVRVKREDPRGILVLTYNRHAAAEVRERLRRLIGDEAAGITVSTCHALAMRLVGASFAGDRDGPRDFDGIVMQAVALLRGDGLPKAEAEALRETLIQGYRWILVDEYQDIGPEEYALIAAVAGRTLEDRELRLSLFAVGDDDQNIYAFAGASIDFIRRFEADYAAKPVYLTENYRSTGHIIAAANAVIAPAPGRMKAGHDIAVNRARAGEAPGGVMAALDPVAQGRVTLLACPPGDGMQAVAAVDELLRLSRLDPDWSWRRAAVIAREWRRLEPARTYAEQLGIPVELASETMPSLWRMREMQAFLREMLRDRARLLTIADLVGILNGLPQNRWTDLIGEGIGTLARELVEKAAPVPDLVQWFGEWAREARGEQRGLLLLTAHRAKGLEFDHVAILDGGWDRPSRGEDADAPRRLFYVAMTRARSSLTVLAQGRHPFLRSVGGAVLPREVSPDPTSLPDARRRIIAPDPRLVDLSFAGRLRDADPSLAAIAEAAVGDPVTLSRHGDRWLILDGRERVLGRMAKAFVPPDDAEIIRGDIAVVLQWRRDDGDDAYRHLIRRDEWDVVLPELDPFSRWSG